MTDIISACKITTTVISPRYSRDATEIDITGRSGEILRPSERSGFTTAHPRITGASIGLRSIDKP
eukprot:894464-Prymnesium_polylepis.1